MTAARPNTQQTPADAPDTIGRTFASHGCNYRRVVGANEDREEESLIIVRAQTIVMADHHCAATEAIGILTDRAFVLDTPVLTVAKDIIREDQRQPR